ncbi:MAG: hypothetical protein HZC28_05370 [Spirochaetes bacterium]|nr:hypothetical protein [Spirochaetota bacterium]
MAKADLSIVLTDLRRKLGNVVFSKWKQTNYIRPYIAYNVGNSPAQIEVRASFRTLVSLWKSFGGVIQGSWNHAAEDLNMTGFNHFIGVNAARLREGNVLQVAKPLGMAAPAGLTAVNVTADSVDCRVELPAAAGNVCIVYAVQAWGVACTDNVRLFSVPADNAQPFTITGLATAAKYVVYAMLADAVYADATAISSSISVSVTTAPLG